MSNRPTRPTQPGLIPDAVRPMYLSGNVRLPDGSNAPTGVVIERVCSGSVRREGYTDSTGHFSFLISDQPSGVFADASVGGMATRDDNLSRQSNGERNLAGCEIRATLSGFLSSSIVLGFRRVMDDPHIGTITLRPLAAVEGQTVSMTTGLAPKDARKAYEKGLDNAKDAKWMDAAREFGKAVQIYPKYAIAWFELGKAQQRLQNYDEATNSFRQSLQIDPKFISPYSQLIAMQINQRKWEQVAKDFSELVKLSPYTTPDLYFYAAVANYNLNNKDTAETQVREAANLDTQHKVSQIHHLFGVILADKRDYAAAREQLQLYLKYSPDAPDADKVRQLLAEIQSRL